jgi:hypothetical protein
MQLGTVAIHKVGNKHIACFEVDNGETRELVRIERPTWAEAFSEAQERIEASNKRDGI